MLRMAGVELNEAWAALLGALVGGALSLAGSFAVAWYESRREQKRVERDRRRDNLYLLQDAIDPRVSPVFCSDRSQIRPPARLATP